MSDSWDERKRAQEEEYFKKQNDEALKRLKAREDENKPRLSPINGKPMVQETVMGVVIDRCTESGGIWLDAGELEELLKASKDQEDQPGWLENMLDSLMPK